MGGVYQLESGKTLDGRLIVIGGVATIEDNATVASDVVLLGGLINISGTVTGDLNLFGATANLKDTAVIEGDVVVTSSILNQSNHARVKGKAIHGNDLPNGFIRPDKLNSINQPTLPAASNLYDLIGNVMSLLFFGILMAILAMMAALFFPKAIRRTATALIENPLLSGGIGLLTVIAAPIVIFIFIITLILIPVSLIGILALVVAVFLGWIVIGMELGNRLAALFNAKWHIAVAAGMGTMIFTLIAEILVKVTFLSWALVFVISVLGLGAVILTSFGTRAYKPNSQLPPAAAIPPINE